MNTQKEMDKYIEKIKKDGYCIIPQEYDKETIGKLLDLVKFYYNNPSDKISNLIPLVNRNQPVVYNLQNKDFFFLETVFKSKRIEAILKFFLNDIWYKAIPQDEPNYIFKALGARSSNDAMPLHLDTFIPYSGEFVNMIQTAIILEDQTIENGCTIVVPGSHLYAKYADQSAKKDAVPIESKAGDVVMFDLRIWHATTKNISEKTRWSILATFQRWWIKQQFNITDNLPQEIYEKLTDNQKSILGFCSIPYNTEFEGIDNKRGYDSLLDNVNDYK